MSSRVCRSLDRSLVGRWSVSPGASLVECTVLYNGAPFCAFGMHSEDGASSLNFKLTGSGCVHRNEQDNERSQCVEHGAVPDVRIV